MAKTVVLTNLGEEWCAARLAGTDSSNGRFIGWGTGTGTAVKGDTTLFTESAEDRVAGTVSVDGEAAAAAYQVEGTLVAESDQVITNAGTFTADAAGILIMKVSLDEDDVIDLNEDDQITFTFTIDPS